MTIKQFLVELGKLKKREGWTNDGELLRCKSVCPISAVANKKARRVKFGTAHYVEAAKYLGLAPRLRRRIVRAADSTFAEPRLRAKLEAALELS